MKLSIIVPVFNEEKTIVPVLKELVSLKIPKVEKEIIVVNDGSQDNTQQVIVNYLKEKKTTGISFYSYKQNIGKGGAIKIGIKNAKGEYIVIQDADLEYNPKDIIRLMHEVTNNTAQVVYGTRLNRFPNFSKEERRTRFLIHYLGNKFLSLVTSILYGSWLTDMETCYKLFPKSAVGTMNLESRGFEFEPEITAKLLKKGFSITEIPITTKPRGYEEGKKLDTIRDGKKALWTLLKYRFNS